ncbi:MAG: hypothetical protein II666_05500, partial [Butyrivibrio sp.]|nr:hypothetical protein [Butyrivibrio sp.]
APQKTAEQCAQKYSRALFEFFRYLQHDDSHFYMYISAAEIADTGLILLHNGDKVKWCGGAVYPKQRPSPFAK